MATVRASINIFPSIRVQNFKSEIVAKAFRPGPWYTAVPTDQITSCPNQISLRRLFES
jgi:hypothetical protein